MGYLVKKSEQNNDAAKLLLSKDLFASSVHCSYFACFQLMKSHVKHILNIDYLTLDNRIKSKSKSTHKYLIGLMTNKVHHVLSSEDAHTFKTKLKELKQLRVETDYENIEITQEKSTKALELSETVRNIIVKTF
jgi:hypothetical protein